jgi:hypothetical protein
VYVFRTSNVRYQDALRNGALARRNIFGLGEEEEYEGEEEEKGGAVLEYYCAKSPSRHIRQREGLSALVQEASFLVHDYANSSNHTCTNPVS